MMGKAEKVVQAIALVCVIAIGATVSPNGLPTKNPIYQLHTPILIEGNSDLTSVNGVSSGDGTSSNPYVIEGWGIDLSSAPQYTQGIEIRNTNASLIIRKVQVHSGGQGSGGILLFKVANMRVENVTFSSNFYGIHINNSSKVTVSKNDVHSNSDGIFVSYSQNITISGNSASSNIQTGIVLLSSTGITITDNVISSSQHGIDVDGSDGISVHHNDFLVNIVQALDYGANSWDDGYPSGGNFWSNSWGVDKCSGLNQDVCLGPDGIADTPYVIDSNSVDRYPLLTGRAKPPSPTFWQQYWYLIIAGIFAAAAVPVLLRNIPRTGKQVAEDRPLVS